MIVGIMILAGTFRWNELMVILGVVRPCVRMAMGLVVVLVWSGEDERWDVVGERA